MNHEYSIQNALWSHKREFWINSKCKWPLSNSYNFGKLVNTEQLVDYSFLCFESSFTIVLFGPIANCYFFTKQFLPVWAKFILYTVMCWQRFWRKSYSWIMRIRPRSCIELWKYYTYIRVFVFEQANIWYIQIGRCKLQIVVTAPYGGALYGSRQRSGEDGPQHDIDDLESEQVNSLNNHFVLQMGIGGVRCYRSCVTWYW